METCPTCGEPLGEQDFCAVCMVAGALDPTPSEPGTFGRYRILRLVGEGGMGAVYEAEQDHPHRTVALKVIKTGLLNPELLRRFTQESETLARLHHPGIAQVYESGTADNGFGAQPYFAMEFIQGEPLDQYANACNLSTARRLRLMVQICDAVEHAHQRGIIHRDLKPANILVEEHGSPKILDFGVARMTDLDAQATRQTGLGQLVGTLAYMSPEQVLADPLELDTRSDVYTLGVILYELLAERLPYAITRHLNQAVEAIREQDPPMLGAINREYRGDIEIIVAKALEKEKTRRYSSAANLGADIVRFLEDQPIAARRPSAAYQVRKFTRRHRGLVAGVAAVFLALVAGLVASAVEAGRARMAEHAALAAKQAATLERDRAVAAEAQAEQATGKAAASEAQARRDRDQAMREQQRADTESATAKAVNEFLLKDLLAQASNQVQAGPGAKPDPDLKIRTALDRAAARIQGKFERQPYVEASIRQTVGESYLDLGLYPQAQAQLERAVELRQRASGADSLEAARTMRSLAEVYEFQGKYARTEQLLTHVLAVESRSLGEQDPETLRTMSDLAVAYRYLANYSRAQPLFTKVLEAQRDTIGEENPDTLATMSALGESYQKQGMSEKAAQIFTRVLAVSRKVLGEEHPTTVSAMNDLANAYLTEGQYPEAERLYSSVHEIQRRVRGEEHPNTLLTSANLALLAWREGKLDQAERMYQQLMEAAPRVFGPQHPRTLNFMNHLAGLYREEQEYQLAEALYSKVLAGRRAALGGQHPDTIAAMADLGYVRLKLKQYADAEAVLRESLAAHEKSTSAEWLRFRDESLLGASLAGQRKFELAEPLLLAGYGGLIAQARNIPGPDRPMVHDAGRWILQLYRDWGRADKVARWNQKLLDTNVAEPAK